MIPNFSGFENIVVWIKHIICDFLMHTVHMKQTIIIAYEYYLQAEDRFHQDNLSYSLTNLKIQNNQMSYSFSTLKCSFFLLFISLMINRLKSSNQKKFIHHQNLLLLFSILIFSIISLYHNKSTVFRSLLFSYLWISKDTTCKIKIITYSQTSKNHI